MSSTFLGLNTAYTGLQAANSALNTTANNISNAETKGYSRQEVTTQAADSIRAFTSYGCVGAGVETLSIERVRDSFYDEKYWANNSKLGEYESKQYYMACIEEYFCDDDSIKGFSTIFNEYYNTISELSKNPGDNTVRNQMIGYAGNLTAYFNDMFTNLKKMQSDVNQEIKVNIDRINAIAQEVAALNKQINVIEMNTPAMANELRDQRDVLIDELSEIADVTVEETPIIDNNDTSRDTGGTRYTVYICGQAIIDGNDYKTLTCVPRANDEAVNMTDQDGLYDVYFTGDQDWTIEDYKSKGDELNMYAKTVGGKLGGLVSMRDGNNGENFAGVVTAVDEAAQSVTIKVDKDYLIDLTKLNLTTSGGEISIGNNNYYFDDWEYNYDESTGECTYTITLDKEKNGKNQITQNAATKQMNAEVGPSIMYQGIPYYMSQMNEWCRRYSMAFNDIMAEGVQDNGDPGIDMFTGKNLVDGTEYKFSVPVKGDGTSTITVTNKDDSYYQITAGNFAVTSEIVNDPSKFATRRDQYSGADDNNLVTDMIDLKTNAKRMSYRGCSSDQFLVCILSDISLNAQRANEFTDSYKVLRNNIENQRLSVSGVDNDEEAVNLTKYQQQYNLASKMISVLAEVYDRLILQTGV